MSTGAPSPVTRAGTGAAPAGAFTSPRSGTFVELTSPSSGHGERELADAPPLPPPSREASASLLSRISFAWVQPLLRLGHRKPLDTGDLYDLSFSDAARGVSERFNACWEGECSRSSPSLARALGRAYAKPFLAAALFKFLHDCLLFVGPIMLRKVIHFLEDPYAPPEQGYYYVAALLGAAIVQSICLRQYFFRCFRTGMHLRSAVITSVYAKSLRLSAGARARYTSGEITNLMSVDAQRLQDLTSYLHTIWSGPFQIAVALYFLAGEVGLAAAGGVGVILLLIPLSGWISRIMSSMQERLMRVKDRRAKIMNEVLAGMKIIKLQAWELSFIARIGRIRSQELARLKKFILVDALSSVLWNGAPVAVAVATFALYVLLGNTLHVATAFTALALFDILRFPLFVLPTVVNSLVQARVSIGRVRGFLLSEEIAAVEQGDLVQPGVRIRSADLQWDVAAVEEGIGGDDDDSPAPRAAAPAAAANASTTAGAGAGAAAVAGAAAGSGGKGYSRFEDEAEDKEAPASVEAAVEDGAASSAPVAAQAPPTPLALRDITFEARAGELVVVVGSVGSGKSSMLSAILGDIRCVRGQVHRLGRVALVSQQPFIQNATLRANVCFGSPLDLDRYLHTLHACALVQDLRVLPAGDATEIGEKGITLSGGQRARVSLARAVYSDADLYLLDDPLSAVDSHVGKHIFKHCIAGVLSGKLRILVTNAMQYVRYADRVVVMDSGRIVEQGTYAEVMSQNGRLSAMMATHESDMHQHRSLRADGSDSVSEDEEEGAAAAHQVTLRQAGEGSPRARAASHGHFDAATVAAALQGASGEGGQLVQNEERAVGNVSRHVYAAYLRSAGGFWAVLAVVLAFIVSEALNVGTKWWLSYWSDAANESPRAALNFTSLRVDEQELVTSVHASISSNINGISSSNSSGENGFTQEHPTSFYLAVYSLICLGSVLAVLWRSTLGLLRGLVASRRLHDRLLGSVMRAPMQFFDTTPLGRVMNRFTKDVYTLDEQLPDTLTSYLVQMFRVMATLVVVGSVTPWFIVALLPLGALYTYSQRYYIRTNRELKRLDSLTRSPIYAHFAESLDGCATIRAYNENARFVQTNHLLLDTNQRAYFLTIVTNCWLALRLEFAGSCIVAIAALLAVLEHSPSMDPSFPGLAGLAISFALAVTQSLNWTVRMASESETQCVAVERVLQYCDMPVEAPSVIEASRPPESWPALGRLEFKDVVMRYRPELPPALRGVSFVVQPGEKVGVVGRTGSGKSTTVLALMRLVELHEGRILLDDVDIATIGLHDLRSRIAVIPQDPILFSGTIRDNIDPFSQYSDAQLWASLRRAHLADAVAEMEGELDATVAEGGSNFSLGQRALLCIARALLRDAKVIALDEATAAVDVQTDAVIQRTIRDEFRHKTVVTIAHRLNTIMDSDRVLVMDAGRVAEFDTPARLLARPNSLFAGLVAGWQQAQGEH